MLIAHHLGILPSFLKKEILHNQFALVHRQIDLAVWEQVQQPTIVEVQVRRIAFNRVLHRAHSACR